MQLEVAKASMRLLADLGHAGILENAGISRADFERLTGPLPWLNTERNRMTVALQTLILGSIDALGLPRFKVPAEYSAAGICMFVHPINCHAACEFLATTPDAETMGRVCYGNESQKGERVTSERLFALVVQLFSDDIRTSARKLFEKNTSLALDKVVKEGKKVYA